MECDRSQVLFLPLLSWLLFPVCMLTGGFGGEFGQARRPPSTRLSSMNMGERSYSVLAKRSHQLLRICTYTINRPGGRSLVVSLSIGPFVPTRLARVFPTYCLGPVPLFRRELDPLMLADCVHE